MLTNNHSSISQLFQATAYFQMLDEQGRRDLEQGAAFVSVDCGQQIFSRDDPSIAVYLVVDGEIEISVTSENGRTLQVAHVRPGEVFGEFGALDGGLRTADSCAAIDSKLVRIRRDAFLRAVTNSADMSARVIVDMISKLRQTNIQIEELTFRPLRARVARLLMYLSDDGAQRAIRTTQSQLATRLSATREKVNVHLRVMQNGGAIDLRRGAIDIRDITILSEFADEVVGAA